MTNIAIILEHSMQKLGNIFSTFLGWILAIALFVADYFAGHSFICMLVVAVTFMDAVWGIALSLKRGEFALSELGRLTIAKLAVYGCVMFVFVGLDKQVDNNIAASAIGTAIVLVELWSSCGSMSVLFPEFLFLRLMRRLLVGEIARKLQVQESQVEEEIAKLKGKKATATTTTTIKTDSEDDQKANPQ